ncbi:MAG: hypothetical protein WA979_01715 [Pacificimonas sp.]
MITVRGFKRSNFPPSMNAPPWRLEDIPIVTRPEVIVRIRIAATRRCDIRKGVKSCVWT